MAEFTNQATLTYTGGTALSNVVTGEVVSVLSATKTAVRQTYKNGDTVTYVISINNTGTEAISINTLTDNLGSYAFSETQNLVPLTYVQNTVLYYVNGVLQSTLTPTATNPLTFENIIVPEGGNATIIYDTTLNGYAPLGENSTINNTVTIDSNEVANPVEATETITASSEPVLSISKNASPTTVPENGRITYTFLIQNYGNTAAGVDDNIVVSDRFDPVLNALTVTLNGDTLPTTSYQYQNANFSTNQGVITVDAATYTQDPTTGTIGITPGTATLVVSGIVQ